MKKLLLITALLTISLNASAKCDKDFLVANAAFNEVIVNTSSIKFIDKKSVRETETTVGYTVSRIHFTNGDKLHIRESLEQVKKRLCLK